MHETTGGPVEPGPAASGARANNVAAEDVRRLQPATLLPLGGAAAFVIGLLLGPFLPAMVTSGVLAVLVYPAYRPIERRISRKNLAALIGTVIVFFLILLPVAGLSILLLDHIRTGADWIATEAPAFIAPGGPLSSWLQLAADRIGIDPSGLPRPPPLPARPPPPARRAAGAGRGRAAPPPARPPARRAPAPAPPGPARRPRRGPPREPGGAA